MHPPVFIDVFLSPIRDNSMAQVALMAFFFFMVLDILLGYAGAVKNRNVRSAKMRKGIFHKTGELGVLAVGDIVDGMILGGITLPFTAPVMTTLAVYLALNEAISCLENAVNLDPELANKRFFRSLETSFKSASNANGGASDNA